MSAPVRVHRTAPGVVLSETAMVVGLERLLRSHELELERAEQQRLEHRRGTNRDRRFALAQQGNLV